jgi:hypothetical protein
MTLQPPISNRISIELDSLSNGRIGLTPNFGGCLSEAASICISSTNHQSSPVSMNVQGDFNYIVDLGWEKVTNQTQRTWNDEEVTTEHAAYGIAALLVEEHGLEVVERSRKGTGFDYWLGERGNQDILFQNKARLEVSGIRNGTQTDIDLRTKKKERQTKVSDNLTIPAIIAVVEFSNPTAKLVSRCSK